MSAAKPSAIPMPRLSTTSTGIGDSLAASLAASYVPDMSADRWMDTMPSAPASASAR